MSQQFPKFPERDFPIHPNVKDLRALVDGNERLKNALINSFKNAHDLFPDVYPGFDNSIEMVFNYFEQCEKNIPLVHDKVNYVNAVGYYFLIDQDDYLRDDCDEFKEWNARWVEIWGNKLNLHESKEYIDKFIKNNQLRMDDYVVEDWHSFNHWFCRPTKPGARPIDSPDDDSVVVFAADSTFAEILPISDDNTIPVSVVKNNKVSYIEQLLSYEEEIAQTGEKISVPSKYAHSFAGGTFLHAYLSAKDYHRYHVPVTGFVKEVKRVRQWNYKKIIFDKYNTAKPPQLVDCDETGYQFTQTRGWIILQTKYYGLVAVIPIGMDQVASVNLKTKGRDIRDGSIEGEEPDFFIKGDEFGYFLFGGSDCILMFQKDAQFQLDRDIQDQFDQRKRAKDEIDEGHEIEDEEEKKKAVTKAWKHWNYWNDKIHRFQGNKIGTMKTVGFNPNEEEEVEGENQIDS